MAALVYDQIRANILDGVLKPGAPLSQLAIAKTSGTSRGPIREALRRLQQEQLVIARANHRFNVAPFDIADLEAVLSLHLVNVTFAIRASVPFLTDSDLRHLEKCVASMERLVDSDREKWETSYREFTVTIVKYAGLRVESLVSHLIDNIERYRKNTLHSVPKVYTGGPEFRQILAAAVLRDGKLASTRFCKFVGRTSVLILAGVAPQHDAARLRGHVLALCSFEDFQ